MMDRNGTILSPHHKTIWSSLVFTCCALMLLSGCNKQDDPPVPADPASSSSSSSSSISSSVSSTSASSASSMSSVSSVSASSSSSQSAGPLPLSTTAISLDDRHQVGDSHWPDGDTADGGQGQPIAGLQCNVTSEAYHVHAHLSIYLNGQALAVPATIGIVQTSPTSHCNYAVHTHDSSGIIHVEAPAAATFTLGQLFALWGQPLSFNDVAGNPGVPVVVYVTDNNVVTQYTGDLAAIELSSHREITIQLGTAITEIPNYTWSGL
ncbi:MAG TPA: hypothetical protein VHL14_02120 [Steroidobacteraceae bacterium]|nr:hypothetical protein [Steroidobacteraceae bacterium]